MMNWLPKISTSPAARSSANSFTALVTPSSHHPAFAVVVAGDIAARSHLARSELEVTLDVVIEMVAVDVDPVEAPIGKAIENGIRVAAMDLDGPRLDRRAEALLDAREALLHLVGAALCRAAVPGPLVGRRDLERPRVDQMQLLRACHGQQALRKVAEVNAHLHANGSFRQLRQDRPAHTVPRRSSREAPQP